MRLSAETEAKLQLAFRPHAPIVDISSFQGRTQERERVSSALASEGLHVVIFGERGAGKTSLANVATVSATRVQAFCEKDANFSSLCRAILLSYAKLNPSTIIYDATTSTVKKGGLNFNLNTITGNELRSLLPAHPDKLCIVLDEIDRVTNAVALEQLAELCKNFSTYQTNITMILVGVAATADALLRGHSSNVRNLRQVALERMSNKELTDILRHAEGVLSIKFSDDVESGLINVSDRFPYFVHLIGMSSAKAALIRGSSTIEKEDYDAGLLAAAQDCDAELSNTYEGATPSAQQSEIYRRIIWSVSEMDPRVVTSTMILEKVNALAKLEGDSAISLQAMGAALKKLVDERKRFILTKEDERFYRFTNPLMRGFVRLVRSKGK